MHIDQKHCCSTWENSSWEINAFPPEQRNLSTKVDRENYKINNEGIGSNRKECIEAYSIH